MGKKAKKRGGWSNKFASKEERSAAEARGARPPSGVPCGTGQSGDTTSPSPIRDAESGAGSSG